ncbi:MAG: hypothetical protein RR189_03125 [Bacilli bacterium]
MVINIENLNILRNKKISGFKFGSLYKNFNGFIEYQIFINGHDCLVTYGTKCGEKFDYIDTNDCIGYSNDRYLEYDEKEKKVISKSYF